ncbi:hypothetical protein BaRGS_00027344 [Batillaria attramentaria]|uniref:Activation-induced cytidine deaminase AID domain-containing protein n=1 Tax=Batillaria attramentaria TaxID=370345 RepID=A0ABD0K327_9CAEN
MEGTDGYKVLQTFISSGLHGSKHGWPTLVYALTLCRLNDQSVCLYKKNRGRHHAEDNMLSFLKEAIVNRLFLSQQLTMYVNYSPCHNCSDLIVKFLHWAELHYGINLQLEIAFPALYRIRRPSCEEEGHTHKLADADDHDRNVKGLERLKGIGVTIRPMNAVDWSTIARGLNVPFVYEGSARQQEDAVLHKDFKRVVDREEGGMNDLVPMLRNVHLRGAVPPQTEDDAFDMSLH